MIYSNTIQVLNESSPRMTQVKLYRFSHSLNGFTFYDLNIQGHSSQKEIEFIEDTLTRQGIPANIYPDRLKDEVIVIRFNHKGYKARKTCPYFELLHMNNQAPLNTREKTGDALIVESLLNEWDNQIRYGNMYSLSQFMKPDKE